MRGEGGLRLIFPLFLLFLIEKRKTVDQPARIKIFQSSHINYRGFSSKSHIIGSLFRKQKKGIRATVTGFSNYKYRELPGHTNNTNL